MYSKNLSMASEASSKSRQSEPSQPTSCGTAGDYGKDDVITAEAYAQHAKQWKALGASVVGGCCAIGPEHIKRMREMIK